MAVSLQNAFLVRSRVEVFTARHNGFSDQATIVARCWNLPAINSRYASFIEVDNDFLGLYTTGVAGLTLGGGFGWLSRLHGLTIDNLLSVDIVTVEGDLVRASATERSDLFWGIRGGGGNFGIVTSFEFRLHPVGPTVLAGLADSGCTFEGDSNSMRYDIGIAGLGVMESITAVGGTLAAGFTTRDAVTAVDHAFVLSFTLNDIVWVPALKVERANEFAVPMVPLSDDVHSYPAMEPSPSVP